MPGLGSFRLSAFRQRGSIAGGDPPHPVRHPDARHRSTCRRCWRKLVLEKRGLILMVGATGTGKSTTLASMLE